MTCIWEIVAEIGMELHPDRVNAIADRIEVLSSTVEFEKAKRDIGLVANNVLMTELGSVWRDNSDFSPKELAAALRSSSMTASRMRKRETVEMVWTGPFTGLVASRHTEQVLLEIIESARCDLFIVSFVAYDIDSVRKALQNAINRNVRICILLESSKKYGGKIDIDSIDALKKTIPEANVYAWNSESKTSTFSSGAVHAKCVVADGSLAFITSANLTRSAMEKNMELGVLVRGGKLPEKLERHLESLVTTGVIEKI